MKRRRGTGISDTIFLGNDRNKMSAEHERIIHDNAPSPEQLFRLASIGMGEVARRKRLKRSPYSRDDNRSYFFISEFGTYNGIRESEKPLEIRHQMAGRMGRKTLERFNTIWSLKYFDTFWVQQDDETWQAERTRYRFEWDRKRTLLAERHIRFLRPSEMAVDRDLADEIEAFSFADDEDIIWHTRGEIETVTDRDCDLLVEDVRSYYAHLAQAEGVGGKAA